MAKTESSLEMLYDVVKKIDDNKKNGKASENIALFNVILQATKGDSTAKRLSSQFIARLFKDFPDEQKVAFNTVLDLIEDEDAIVRRQVISDLPKLCKDVIAYVPKVADILVQLLQTDDSQELSLVHTALLQLIGAHPSEALQGVLDQLGQPELPDLCRERAFRLLASRVQQMSLSPKLEEMLIERVQPLMEGASELEFGSLVQLLASLSCMQTLTGRQKLLDTVSRQAGLGEDFAPGDPVCLARLRECARLALPFLSKNINAKAFVAYFLDKVIPALDTVPAELEGENPRLDLLKSLAELSGHSGGAFSASEAQLSGLLERLKQRLPLPSDAGDAAAPADAPPADAAGLTQSECLLYALHQAAKTRPEFLAGAAELLADLRKRLQLLHHAAQAYQRSHKPAPGEAKTRIGDNIGALVKDLFRNPPTYKADLTLSWKPAPAAPVAAAKPATAVTAPPAAADQRKRPAGQEWGRGEQAFKRGGGGAGGYVARGRGGRRW